MKNFRITLEYDGGRYYGWQRLGKEESTNTVENKIKEVWKKMAGENAEIFCASRTEAGVHAYGQVISIKSDTTSSPKEIKRYMNRYLPMDIAVLDVEEVPERFHAALNALSRTYTYRIAVGDTPSVFERKYVYYCFGQPDAGRMKTAASLLTGEHDFHDFSTAKKNKSTVKAISSIDIYADPKEIQISITANDFLHNMARMIVSTLLDIGLGKRPLSDIDKILDRNDEMTASMPADPSGMFLDHVEYRQ